MGQRRPATPGGIGSFCTSTNRLFEFVFMGENNPKHPAGMRLQQVMGIDGTDFAYE